MEKQSQKKNGKLNETKTIDSAVNNKFVIKWAYIVI